MVYAIGSTFVWNAANLQTINFTHTCHFFFYLFKFIVLKKLKECKKLFKSYSFFTHLMEMASLGQQTCKGYCLSNQISACFVLYLKIINTFFEKWYMYLQGTQK